MTQKTQNLLHDLKSLARSKPNLVPTYTVPILQKSKQLGEYDSKCDLESQLLKWARPATSPQQTLLSPAGICQSITPPHSHKSWTNTHHATWSLSYIWARPAISPKQHCSTLRHMPNLLHDSKTKIKSKTREPHPGKFEREWPRLRNWTTSNKSNW